MKFFLLSFSVLLLSVSANAQNFHLNLYGGTSNYSGDLQDKNFTFNQSHLAGGFGISYDINDHFSIRSGLMFGKVSADDKYGRNKIRNLNFTSSITDVNLGLEYYITPLEDHSLTPYVFAGVGIYHFNPYTSDTSGKKIFLRPLSTEGQGFIPGVNYYNLTQFAIPYGAGIKLSLSDDINVGMEIGYRKLFTDYLDDVSTNYVDQALLNSNRGATAVELAYRGNELKGGAPYPPAGTIRGSAKHNDSYYFTTFTISFRLGSSNPWSGKHSEYNCPPKVQ